MRHVTDDAKRKAQTLWQKQCTAAIGIIDRQGIEQALGYLVGEKFSNFLRAADSDPALRKDVPAFAQAIKTIFPHAQLRSYLDHVRRLGPLGHAATEEQFQAFRAAGALDQEDMDDQLEALIHIEQMKKLLLGQS